MTETTQEEAIETAEGSQESHEEPCSSIGGVIFNFTNSIIGAGAIGLGGAMAESGGLVSAGLIVFFAILTKYSLDLVIDLSGGRGYESLGKECAGNVGWWAVILSKWLYSFGCLVAYLVVVKENFASAIGLEDQSILITLVLSVTVVLPLCMLRDMSPLSNLSLLSVVSMTVIVLLVIVLMIFEPSLRHDGFTTKQMWLEVRLGGLWQSLGTFVFSFVSQHTVHLAYESMSEETRNLANWKRVSFYSIGISTIVSLSIGLVVYGTFGLDTTSNLFELYPAGLSMNVAKLLLCLTMLLTFPLPFFTCRDVLVCVAVEFKTNHIRAVESGQIESVGDSATHNDLEEPLLEVSAQEELTRDDVVDADEDDQEPLVDSDIQDEQETVSVLQAMEAPTPSWILLDRQLIWPLHSAVTALLWAIVTSLAIVVPNLADVLNIVGCATGTLLAFVLPGVFSLQKQRRLTVLPTILLVVGSGVGCIGTYFSILQLVKDVSSGEQTD